MDEIVKAAKAVEDGNPWYTTDQLAGQTNGMYRYNMKLRFQYVEKYSEPQCQDHKMTKLRWKNRSSD